MPTPIVRLPGTAVTPVTVSAITSGAPGYASSAMRIKTSTLIPAGALIGDFRLTSITWGGTPAAAGAIQLFAVDRDFSGNIGPTPGANYIPRWCATFSPQTLVSGGSPVMAANNVSLSEDADYYVGNNATGVTFACTLNFKPYAPGT